MTVVNKRVFMMQKKVQIISDGSWISHRNSQRKKILRLFHFTCPLTVKRIEGNGRSRCQEFYQEMVQDHPTVF